MLLPGWIKHSILDQYRYLATLPDVFAAPKFNFGVHIRNQLHHFEQNVKPDDAIASLKSKEYAESQQTKNLFLNLERRIEHLHPKNASVYISSDNDLVRDILSRRLVDKGYRVYRSVSAGVVHSKSASVLGKLTSNNGFFELLLDLKCLASSDTILAWRDVKPKFAVRYLSTFAKSAKLMANSEHAFVLIDPMRVDPSDKNWKRF